VKETGDGDEGGALSASSPDATYYAQRALSHIRQLARSGRGSTTPAEHQAAEYVQTQLSVLGVADTLLQPFSGERSLWLFVALFTGLALVGHAAFWLLRSPTGDLPAIIVSELAFGFSFYLAWKRFTWQDFPLQSSLPHAPSQNVIAKLPSGGTVQRRIVLLAHLDSHRSVFWFASELLVRIFMPISTITIAGIFLAGLSYLLAVLTQWQGFAWLGLFFAFFHFLGWFTGVTADLGRYSPGANDNASSVGTLLAIAEHLVKEPLQNTELWLAFTGCEESDASGISAVIDTYGKELKDAWFIDFEMVGIGDCLGYIRQEGSFTRVRIPPEIETEFKALGEPSGLQPLKTPLFGASTECGLLLKHGYKAACLMSFPTEAKVMPEWHRITDTPDKIQPASLERVQSLAWELIQRLDRGGPHL
jgi:hypothetical protein